MDPRLGTFTKRHRVCKMCHQVTEEKATEPLFWAGEIVGKRLLPHRPCYHCGAEIVALTTKAPSGYRWAAPLPPLGATMGRTPDWKIRIRL